jgi:hypothetical protein
MVKVLPGPLQNWSRSESVFDTVAVKLTELPGVMYSMSPCPQSLVLTPKFSVSAVAGWVVVSTVVEFAVPAIDPDPSRVPDIPPSRQNQEPEHELLVHVRVRVTFPPPVFACAGTPTDAARSAMMRIPKARIPSLTGSNRRVRASLIERSSSRSVVRCVVTHSA